MKFSRDTLDILKNFATINSGISLSKGSFIMTRAVNGTSYAEANIPDTIDNDFSIYDLNGFISILSFVGDDAEIQLESDGNISVKDTRSTIYWPAADPATIASPKARITFPVSNVIFELKGEDMQQLMRVSRSMQIDTLGISREGDKIVISGYNKAADSSSLKVLYSLVAGNYDGTNDFTFFVNIANMKMQPADYKVMIASQGAIKFEGAHATYILAIEADSSHNF